jgi:F0F1-type ATP synthase membrane subunit b/b'
LRNLSGLFDINMKFAAVVLLACVAVSSAAFTGSLVQHTQPALGKAMFQIRLVAGDKAIALPGIQQILDSIQAQVNSLIQQAQAAIQHGQAISQALYQQLQAAAQAAAAIGGQAAEQIQSVIQSLLDGVTSILPAGNKNNKLSLGEIISSVQSAAQQATELAYQLISQIDLSSLMTQAINQVLPQNVANLVNALLGLNNKGIIGDLFGNLWGQITDVAGQVASQIAAVVSQVTSIGQSAFAEVQAQASQFLANVASGASHLSAQAAQQILAHISDLQEALGDQYQAVVDALSNIVINGGK